MKYFVIVLFFIGFLPVFAEETESSILTPFDVILSEDDFTTQGPNHNILVLNKGNSTEINVYVKNNDDVPHTIRLFSPTDSDSSTFSTFKFQPKEILVLPNNINSTKLYMTVSNQTDTHSTFVTFLGQSDVFGMKGLGFYLVVDDEFSQWTDYSLRSGLPGAAFPHLDTDISEVDAKKIITNGLGIPKYIPQEYKFRGVTDREDSQQFVYSKSSVTTLTESTQFWKDDGIMIFYGVDGPNVNNTQSLPFKVAQDEGKQVMINGLMGMATEQTSRTVMDSDLTYKVPAELYFFDDNEKTSVVIKANLTLDEILKVASSIPRFSSNLNKPELTDGMEIDGAIEYPPRKFSMPPLKQLKSGITIDDIQCRKSMILILKYDGSPACVKPESIPKLIERGWAKSGIKEHQPPINTKNKVVTPRPELEHLKDESVVEAFYSQYGKVTESERIDHLSFSAGNGNDFLVRMNLYFDENYELTHKRLYCYHDNGVFQYEIAQEDILGYLQNHHCLTFKIGRDIPFELVDSKDVIYASNQFAMDFYSHVSQEPTENIFFSPWSISTAFAIAFEGAAGNTADEMQQVFGFPDNMVNGREQYKSANIELNKKDAQYTLDIANALWLQEGFIPNQGYVNIARDYYDSSVDQVDFTTNGVDIINEWVKQKTQEKIEELFPPGSRPTAKLAITNAIYFNGTWANPFNVEQTQEDLFWVTPDQSIMTPMMQLDTTFLNYTMTENLQILKLPYKGDKLSMIVLLPNEKHGLKSVQAMLSAEKLSEWQKALKKSKVLVIMPKFELETNYDLKPILQSLGMIDAFGPADFSIISNSGLFISEAVHKSFVNVNEKGTEAAAATGIIMDESGPQVFRADHPFLFIIQDDTTENILFIGRMSNPE